MAIRRPLGISVNNLAVQTLSHEMRTQEIGQTGGHGIFLEKDPPGPVKFETSHLKFI